MKPRARRSHQSGSWPTASSHTHTDANSCLHIECATGNIHTTVHRMHDSHLPLAASAELAACIEILQTTRRTAAVVHTPHYTGLKKEKHSAADKSKPGRVSEALPECACARWTWQWRRSPDHCIITISCSSVCNIDRPPIMHRPGLACHQRCESCVVLSRSPAAMLFRALENHSDEQSTGRLEVIVCLRCWQWHWQGLGLE